MLHRLLLSQVDCQRRAAACLGPLAGGLPPCRHAATVPILPPPSLQQQRIWDPASPTATTHLALLQLPLGPAAATAPAATPAACTAEAAAMAGGVVGGIRRSWAVVCYRCLWITSTDRGKAAGPAGAGACMAPLLLQQVGHRRCGAPRSPPDSSAGPGAWPPSSWVMFRQWAPVHEALCRRRCHVWPCAGMCNVPAPGGPRLLRWPGRFKSSGGREREIEKDSACAVAREVWASRRSV